ncbi:MAG TPA: glycosyltransferase [Acidimicrobiales bacterium]|nr:glycosyltransferase [Acidimicrobiales bacterium]
MSVTCSVIVPTHDRPAMLADAVLSVLGQRVSTVECIVVDDGSRPPVDLAGDRRLVVLRRPDAGGPAAARNMGLSAATGDVVAFLDDDDVLVPERLDLALAGLERAPVAICADAPLDDPGASGSGRRLEGRVHDVILDATTPQLGATAVRRSDVVAFDEAYLGCEDVDWWLRMSERAAVTTVARVGLLVRRHGGDRGLAGTRARIDGSLRLLDQHGAYFATHPRALAFRWRRIGIMAASVGDHAEARRAQVRSLRARPSVRSAVHLARTLRA